MRACAAEAACQSKAARDERRYQPTDAKRHFHDRSMRARHRLIAMRRHYHQAKPQHRLALPLLFLRTSYLIRDHEAIAAPM